MKKRRRIFLIVGVVIMTALVIKAILFFTAEPKVTVDYVAEYNRISRPENYDPNENAAPYYQKAFDVFVEMPKELQEVPYIIGWLTDFNRVEQTNLEEWLASNSQSFEYFKIAANKPYYWMERRAKENNMMTMRLPEVYSLREMTIALTWNAKMKAYKGRLQTAFENIIDCYRAGKQKSWQPSLRIEREVGFDIKRDAIRSAMVILDRVQVDNATLKSFQDTLQAELDKDTYVPDFMADKLFLYDLLQRTFVDNGKGTGRLYWREAKTFPICSPLYLKWYERWVDLWYISRHNKWYGNYPFLNCFIGPTRNEMAKQIEQFFEMFEPLKTQTPWQLHNQNNYLEKIELVYLRNSLLEIGGSNLHKDFYLYHNIKARTAAVITIAAILRFKADNHRLPPSLDELVGAGYLKSLPMDPYSDGPLVYKPTEDNFIIYSVGEDFIDDGGSTKVKTDGAPRKDIPFWPIRRLEKEKEEKEVESQGINEEVK